MYPKLEDIVNLFCNIQQTDSKEEAFIKGYLMGLGAGKGQRINWELLKKDPDMFIPIEKDIMQINQEVTLNHINEAKKLLSNIYSKNNREIPDWLN